MLLSFELLSMLRCFWSINKNVLAAWEKFVRCLREARCFEWLRCWILWGAAEHAESEEPSELLLLLLNAVQFASIHRPVRVRIVDKIEEIFIILRRAYHELLWSLHVTCITGRGARERVGGGGSNRRPPLLRLLITARLRRIAPGTRILLLLRIRILHFLRCFQLDFDF